MLDISWAINHFKTYNGLYSLYSRYYDGDHLSVLRTYEARKMVGRLADVFDNYCDNLCPNVVNTFTDRLQVSDFAADPAELEVISGIWKTSKLDINSSIIHKNTVKLGDSYVIVWFDKKGNPRVYIQDPRNIAIKLDEDGDIIQAVKSWSDENSRQRVTIYTPEAIERYITKGKVTKLSTKLDLIPFEEDGDYIINNPFGKVPVFRFANSSEAYAESEIKHVIKLQDSLNWITLYMYLAALNESLPMRAIFGVEPTIDDNGAPVPLKTGPGQILQVPNENASISQLSGADLSQFLAIQDNIRAEIARVTNTPLHIFQLQSGDFPSGKSLETAERPLTAKVKDRQIGFGDTWEQIMKFGCILAGITTPGDITCNWTDTSSDTTKEDTETLMNKQALGVTKPQLLLEMGYTQDKVDEMCSQDAQPENQVQ